MKLKSTPDGLKAVKVNPYDGPEFQYEIWEKFNINNPALDLTTPMPGNTVFEGVDEPVWQYKTRLTDIKHKWVTCSIEDLAEMKKDGYATRQAYQPLEVQEQVREEAEKVGIKGMNDVLYPIANIKSQNGLKRDIVELTLNLATPDDDCMLSDFLHALQFVLDKHNVTPKASNPELGAEENMQTWFDGMDGADYSRETIFKAGYQQRIIDEQGLVSLESVIDELEAERDTLNKFAKAAPHVPKAKYNYASKVLRNVIDKLKTLKQ